MRTAQKDREKELKVLDLKMEEGGHEPIGVGHLWKLGKGMETDSLLEPPEGWLPYGLILDCDFQNCEIIKLCCFKPRSLW